MSIHRAASFLPDGLVRDTVNGKIAGVCAGLGGYLTIRTKWIRLFLILVSVFGFFVPAVIAYIVLALLMPAAPTGFSYGTLDERGQPAPPEAMNTNLRDHFHMLDKRLATMEAWVTSEDYRLRQQFKNL